VIARVGTTWTQSKDQWVWHQGQWVQFLKPAKPTPQDMLCFFNVALNQGTAWSWVGNFSAYLPNRHRRYIRSDPPQWQYEQYGQSRAYWVEGKLMSPTRVAAIDGSPGDASIWRLYEFGPFAGDDLVTQEVPVLVAHSVSREDQGKTRRGL